MIKVIYNEGYKNLKITGHAGYADKGKDIVCASASSIILTSINLAIEFNKDVKYIDDLNKIARLILDKIILDADAQTISFPLSA